jgi:hypothetical protein
MWRWLEPTRRSLTGTAGNLPGASRPHEKIRQHSWRRGIHSATARSWRVRTASWKLVSIGKRSTARRTTTLLRISERYRRTSRRPLPLPQGPRSISQETARQLEFHLLALSLASMRERGRDIRRDIHRGSRGGPGFPVPGFPFQDQGLQGRGFPEIFR